MKQVKNKKGFTLVEVIVVIVILAILVSVTIPTCVGYIHKAKEKSYLDLVREVDLSARKIYTEAYAEGIQIAEIKLNYTSNFQKTEHGGHFCQIEKIYVYKAANSSSTQGLDKSGVISQKYFKKLMSMIDNNTDVYLSGNSCLFFNQKGEIVSNADHKIAGQGSETTLILKNKKKENLAKIKYDDELGWYIAESYK